jgi:glycine/D-amino acid oxidase-like deaminating enzyme
MVAGAMSAASVPPPSFWLADAGEALVPRAPLEGERVADVPIVGAGYTGLSTAYYFAVGDPSLRIAVVEGEVAGFGAAGRNGGWCTLHHAGVEGWMRGPKREGGVALQRAMFDAVGEVGRVAAAEGIDCDYAKAGCLTVVTNEPEGDRVRALLAEARRRGFGESDFRWLDARECNARVRIAGARGGFFSPDGAALQPVKLARGLARAVERRGVAIFERSAATCCLGTTTSSCSTRSTRASEAASSSRGQRDGRRPLLVPEPGALAAMLAAMAALAAIARHRGVAP